MKIPVATHEILRLMVRTQGEAKPESTAPVRNMPVEKIVSETLKNDTETQINKDKQPQQKAQVLQQESAVIAPGMMPQTRPDCEKINAKAGKKQARKGGSWVFVEYRTQNMKNAEIKVFSDNKGLYVSIGVEDEDARKVLSESIEELSSALKKNYKIQKISVQKSVKTGSKNNKNVSKTSGLDLRI